MIESIFRVPAAFLIASAVAFLSGLAGSPPAHACGTIHDGLVKYSSAGDSDVQRESALQELAAYCGGYAGKASDPQLLEMLRDAVERGLEPALVQAVFDTYRCLAGVRGDAGYADLTAAFDGSRCPTDEELEGWHESTVDDALIRQGPTKSAERIGWLKKGAVVEKLGQEGDWMNVRTWTGQTGWVHASLLAKY